MTDMRKILVETANAINQSLKIPDTPLAEKIDALKALTGAYTALKRLGDDDKDEPSEWDFNQGIKETINGAGSSPVRARPRGTGGH